MRDFSGDLRWLSINTATLRKQWSLTEIFEECARYGIGAVSPWRDQVAAVGLKDISRQRRALGLQLSGYCRGGMFPPADASARNAIREDNRRAVDEAVELEAACLVLVVGGLPGALAGSPIHRDIALCRAQVEDGIGELLVYARAQKMPLAIEPLHPMYAADRACINTMHQALDLCDRIDPECSGALGVALDVYHVWWDPSLEAAIARATARRLLAFHVCDWLTPTRDLLNDRGMMGDGVIELRKIRGWIEAAGYAGYSEVEIFSELDWWQRPGGEVIETCIERHQTVV